MHSSSTMATLAATAVGALCLAKIVDANCDGQDPPVITFASSSNRLYVRSGCATMRDLLEYRSDKLGAKGPIYHFDMDTKWYSDVYTGVYYLESSIHVVNGSTLSIDGAESEKDECETLLLASNSSTFQEIRAHGANLDIKYTKITSWDLDAGDVDKNTDDGRSFLNCITEKITGREKDTCPDDPRNGEEFYSSGKAKEDMGNANMDIFRSEIAYLGYDASESYGISYKARGLCKDLTNLDIYDDDNGLNYGVTGDIYRTDIHHNWFGHYSWGHNGGRWQYNTVHDNHGYGFDPHDDSDFVRIVGNTVYNNGWHGIIASKRCTDIRIKKNTVYNNGENGIMLHRSCDRASVRGNHAYDNNDAGLALYETSDCNVYENLFENNKYAIRWSNGANNNRVWDNTLKVGSDDNARYAFYMYKGNDEAQAEGNIDGHPRYNSVWGNDVYSERDDVWLMDEADSNIFSRNTFHSGNTGTFRDAVDNKVNNNEYPEDWVFEVEGTTCFRSGTDPRC